MSKTRMKLAKTIVQWNDIKHIRPKDDNFYLVAEEVDLFCVHRKIRTIEMLRPSQFKPHYEKNFYRRTVTHWAELPKPFGHPAQAPICLQELWLQSAQRPQWRSESATSGLSADNPGAGVNKPYVEPALAGDNKAFDFSRELFTVSPLVCLGSFHCCIFSDRDPFSQSSTLVSQSDTFRE